MDDAGRPTLFLAAEHREVIGQLCARAYPGVAGGFLLGRTEAAGDGDVKYVETFLPLRNTRTLPPGEVLRVTPRELTEAQAEAEATGLTLVGLYQSTPDRLPQPELLARTAGVLLWYSYLLVCVIGGRAAVQMASWSARDEDGLRREQVRTWDGGGGRGGDAEVT